MKCCSAVCDKAKDCANHYFNCVGVHQIEDLYSFGSGSISNEGCTTNYWCGENGNYGLFKPIEKKQNFDETC